MTASSNGHLLAAAAGGDQRSWDVLVDRYADLVWKVARSFRLGRADAADVSQATWLRLVEHLNDIRDADRLGAWLVTTARREALALVRRSARTVPTGDDWRLDGAEEVAEAPDTALLRAEEGASVRRAFAGLSSNCQRLLSVLLATPPPTYAEVADALEMPIGSIGPTRARCLDSLRRRLQVQEGVRDGGEPDR
ncbi:RNA polymerase sigma factor [Luedemannella flava]|uniref:RNA polymerase sigma factor n=1 Tax=Luedemannella flava TaxID=349316 RepID=UPI003CD0B95A